MSDRLLIEEQPRFGHPYRHDRYDGARNPRGGCTISDLTPTIIWILCFRIAVHERYVERDLLTQEKGESPLHCASHVAWEAMRVDRCDPHLPAAVEADLLEMVRER